MAAGQAGQPARAGRVGAVRAADRGQPPADAHPARRRRTAAAAARAGRADERVPDRPARPVPRRGIHPDVDHHGADRAVPPGTVRRRVAPAAGAGLDAAVPGRRRRRAGVRAAAARRLVRRREPQTDQLRLAVAGIAGVAAGKPAAGHPAGVCGAGDERGRFDGRADPRPAGVRRGTDRKSTRLNSSHTVIPSLSLHYALPILVYAPQPLVVWYADENRKRISSDSPWRESLEWLRGSRPRVTRRAYAALAMSVVGSMAAPTRDPRAFAAVQIGRAHV